MLMSVFSVPAMHSIYHLKLCQALTEMTKIDDVFLNRD